MATPIRRVFTLLLPLSSLFLTEAWLHGRPALLSQRGGHRATRCFALSSSSPLPELCVFDLDMCVWSPEMYLLDEVPAAGKSEVRGKLYSEEDSAVTSEGVSGAKSGYETIRLFPAARRILRDYYNGCFPGMRIAAASSADTPLAVRIGRGAMKLLEVEPGVTVEDVFRKDWEGADGQWEEVSPLLLTAAAAPVQFTARARTPQCS